VLRRGADFRAFTLRGQAGRRGQGVLHLHGGRGRPMDGGRQCYGGQDSWGRGLEGNEVEQVLAGALVTKRHLKRTGSKGGVTTGLRNMLRHVFVRADLGAVSPLSVCKERHRVVSTGRSGDIHVFQTLQGHRSIGIVRFQDLHQHAEPEHADTRVTLLS